MDDASAVVKHTMQVDLALLPESVSHLVLALSSRKGDDLSQFDGATMHIFNGEFPEHQLTLCNIENIAAAKANIACRISKALGPWLLENPVQPCAGNVFDYEPIVQAARHCLSGMCQKSG